MPNKSDYSKYYSPRPGVKSKNEPEKSDVGTGPQLDASDVNLLMEGVDTVFARMKDAGEENRLVFVTALTYDPDSMSKHSKLTFVFPPDYQEGGACIQMVDAKVDFNFVTYEKTKPVYVDLTRAKAGMAYYFGTVEIASGDPEDQFEGLQSKSRIEQLYDAIFKDIALTKDDVGYEYTCSAKARTPGYPETDKPSYETLDD